MVASLTEGLNFDDIPGLDRFRSRQLERNRQQATQDLKFFRQYLYFFRIIITEGGTEAAATNFLQSLMVPLVINPQSIEVSEPFTVRATPTAGGGLYVEENGIIQRTIRIQGHTGFSARRNPTSSKIINTQVPPSYTRTDAVFEIGQALSGMKHFQFLQDKVFRTYADIKRDPATAQQVQLHFHMPKDDEHWVVIPQKFTLQRDSSRPLFYNYDIELLAVAPTGAIPFLKNPPEDKDILDNLADAAKVANDFLRDGQAFVNDIGDGISDIGNTIRGFGSVVTNFRGLVASVGNVVNGVARTITAPIDLVSSIAGGLEASGVLLGRLPGNFVNTIETSLDGADRALGLGIVPRLFGGSGQSKVGELSASARLGGIATSDELAEASVNVPTGIQDIEKRTTALKPGDRLRSLTEDADLSPSFSATRAYDVTSTDTLESIAAKQSGSSRFWKTIAILNNLSFPYISEHGLPNTVRPGDQISVPTRGTPPKEQPLPNVYPRTLELSREEQLLGSDFLLAEDEQGFIDMEVDAVGGSTDFSKVRGVENMVQAINTRMRTILGEDTLYQNMGIDRQASIGNAIIDEEMAKLRVREGIIADPRIASVTRVDVINEGPDIFSVDVTAAILGIDEPVRIPTTIG